MSEQPQPPVADALITELVVCTTCRPAGTSRDAPAAGAALFEAVQDAQFDLPAETLRRVRVRGLACMSACGRACTVALQAPGKPSYLFGDLLPDAITARDALLCAALHAEAADGQLLRNQRPERLRNGILAKLPPHGEGASA
jgi:predicted metal-binding protein